MSVERWQLFMTPGRSVDEAMSMAQVNSLLEAPVGGKGVLWRNPGIYPVEGIALYGFGRELRIAIEPHRLSGLAHALFGGEETSFADRVRPAMMIRLIQHHPEFRGRQRGPGFEDGAWYAAAVVQVGD